ncbi:MAG: hypothetical protein ACE15F_12445 [bacterium]
MTALLAPACYYQNAPFFQDKQRVAFDVIVSYDEILGFLAGQASNEYELELTSRYLHKARIVSQAIEKSRRVSEESRGPVTDEFNLKYFQFIHDQPFRFTMRSPGTRSDASGCIWFFYQHPGLKIDRDLMKLKLVHKIGPGHDRLDLQFMGWGKSDAIVRPKLEPLLEYRMRYIVTKNQHTVMISIPLIPINIHKPFEEESPKVRIVLEEANRLMDWLERNRPPLLEIAREIQNQGKGANP